MRRKYIDKRHWKRIVSVKRNMVKEDKEGLTTYIAALFIDKVRESLVCGVEEEKKVCIVDDGYTWIQRLPIGKNWAVTTMFDKNKKIVQWYFDITKLNALDDDGSPFYDDLYLDVVVLSTGEIYLLDEDELEAALISGDITRADFDMAYREADKIQNGIAKDIKKLTEISYSDLEKLK